MLGVMILQGPHTRERLFQRAYSRNDLFSWRGNINYHSVISGHVTRVEFLAGCWPYSIIDYQTQSYSLVRIIICNGYHLQEAFSVQKSRQACLRSTLQPRRCRSSLRYHCLVPTPPRVNAKHSNRVSTISIVQHQHKCISWFDRIWICLICGSKTRRDTLSTDIRPI